MLMLFVAEVKSYKTFSLPIWVLQVQSSQSKKIDRTTCNCDLGFLLSKAIHLINSLPSNTQTLLSLPQVTISDPDGEYATDFVSFSCPSSVALHSNSEMRHHCQFV